MGSSVERGIYYAGELLRSGSLWACRRYHSGGLINFSATSVFFSLSLFPFCVRHSEREIVMSAFQMGEK